MGILDKLLPKLSKTEKQEVTNERLRAEILECFDFSIKKKRVGNIAIFDMHYIIIMSPEAFQEIFQTLPYVVKVVINDFYKRLKKIKKSSEIGSVSSNWVFQFAPGKEFNGEKVDSLIIMGAPTGYNMNENQNNGQAKIKVTIKSKKTTEFERLDLNQDAFKGIDFRATGVFAVKFNPELEWGETSTLTRSKGATLANIEWYLGDQNKEGAYAMKVSEIVIARDTDQDKSIHRGKPNYLLLDSKWISDIHARIRFQEANRQFQIASFSRNETRVNEQLIPRSEAANPKWVNLPTPAKITLNTTVVLKFESTI
ncbi:FHA domain-containing protein [Larkinella sp.]|uniref:FHA domain-containing protein n=1 Tax=Larkinella sp. TaxID=2034517 RepID=UPI003BA8E496